MFNKDGQAENDDDKEDLEAGRSKLQEENKQAKQDYEDAKKLPAGSWDEISTKASRLFKLSDKIDQSAADIKTVTNEIVRYEKHGAGLPDSYLNQESGRIEDQTGLVLDVAMGFSGLANLSKSFSRGAVGAAENAAPSLFHSASPPAVQPILNGGFRTDLPNVVAAGRNNRFGRGVYVADSQAAALVERPGGVVLGVEANLGRNLNITGRGPIYDKAMAQSIARGARKNGYDSITTLSVHRGGGVNTVIFDPARAAATGVVP